MKGVEEAENATEVENMTGVEDTTGVEDMKNDVRKEGNIKAREIVFAQLNKSHM
jgi:hypothetical protein